MRRLVTMLLALPLMIGCDDEESPPGAVCAAVFCDDADPCTTDHCDPSDGTCLFIPNDVANACRTDAHCDDGVACTVDACAIDGCGLQRCRHEESACQRCFQVGDCANDEDACTADLCRDGFCAHLRSPQCEDRRCDPDAPLQSGELRFEGTVEPEEGCGCGCTTGVVIDGERVVTEPPASCTRVCDTESYFDCAPLTVGPRWRVFARSADDRAMHWCLSPSELLQGNSWEVRFTLPGQPVVRCQGSTGAVGENPGVLSLACDSCDGCRLPDVGFIDPLVVGAFASKTTIFFSDPFLGLRRFVWQLFPTPTGFSGTLHSSDDESVESIDGSVVMTLQGLP